MASNTVTNTWHNVFSEAQTGWIKKMCLINKSSFNHFTWRCLPNYIQTKLQRSRILELEGTKGRIQSLYFIDEKTEEAS